MEKKDGFWKKLGKKLAGIGTSVLEVWATNKFGGK